MKTLVYGADEIALKSVAILRRAGLKDVESVPSIEGAAIWSADALVIPWCIQIEGQKGWRELLRDYVRSGGGLVLCHRGCGFYNGMEPPLFPRIARVVDSWNDRRLRVTRHHEAIGWPRGRALGHGYMDHMQLRPGPGGKALVEDARHAPVVVVGEHGRGRVAFLGTGPELAEPPAPRAEVALFAALVRWAGCSGARRGDWEAATARVSKSSEAERARRRDSVRLLMEAAGKQLKLRKGALERRFRQFAATRDPVEKQIKDRLLLMVRSIEENWREFAGVDWRFPVRCRGQAWTGWLAAAMHRATGDDGWARIALRLLRPLGKVEGQVRPFGSFGIYPQAGAYALLKEVGKLSARVDGELRRSMAGSADFHEAVVRDALRTGGWYDNLRFMPAVGLVRTALEMPDHPRALGWFDAGWELVSRHVRDCKVYEDSSIYSPIDQNYLVFFADDCLGDGWFRKRGVRKLFDEFAHVVAPQGWVCGYGACGALNDPADSFLSILERAHTAYGSPQYRAIADRMLEALACTGTQARGWPDSTDMLQVQDAVGYNGYHLMHAWLNHTPGPARFRTIQAVGLQNRVVLRTGWAPGDAFMMLGKRDGWWDHRGSWHGHDDALAICALTAGGKVLLADSAYEHPQKDFHHTILIHLGEVDDPLRLPDCCDQDFSVYQEAIVRRRKDGVGMVIENYDNTGVKVTRSVRLRRDGARLSDRLVASRSGTYTIAQAFFAPEVEELGAGRYRLNRSTSGGEEQPPGPALEVTFSGPSTRFLTREIETIGPQRQVDRVLVARLKKGKPLSLPVSLDFGKGGGIHA